MKNKILAILLICVLNLSLVVEASALLSISHFNLGIMILENLEQQAGKKLSESEKNAFLSGMVYADIGRFYLDKITGVDSDSEKFAEEMRKFVKTSEEKWFVLGFKVHILQDKETGKVLMGIFGEKKFSYKEYLKRCALLDSYFLQNNKLCVLNDTLNESLENFNLDQIISGLNTEEICKTLGIPKDKFLYFINLQIKKYSGYENKYFLTLYDKLIKRTYESFGFKVELNELQVQANNIIVASGVLATVASEKIKPDDKLSICIESETIKISDLCVNYLIREICIKDYK